MSEASTLVNADILEAQRPCAWVRPGMITAQNGDPATMKSWPGGVLPESLPSLSRHQTVTLLSQYDGSELKSNPPEAFALAGLKIFFFFNQSGSMYGWLRQRALRRLQGREDC